MSHFALLVITAKKPTEEKLGRLLAPYQEDDEGGKWDWFQIGGRWTGFFAPGYDPEKDSENRQRCRLCRGTGKRTGKRTDMEVANGCNGCHGTGVELKWPTGWADKGNQIQVADLLLTMDEHLRIATEKAAAKWDAFHSVVAGRALPDFDALRDQHGIDKARDIYWAEPVMQDIQRARFDSFSGFTHLLVTRDQYIERAKIGALTTYAVLKDGEWYEQGEMGWFGCSSNEKEPEVWQRQFSALLSSLKPSDWLTIVDCHI